MEHRSASSPVPMDPALPLVERIHGHGEATALDAPDGVWSYADLAIASARIAALLQGELDDLAEARVAYLVEPGGRHVAVQLAIWRAGGIAVPLATSHPPAELEYVVRDAGVSLLIVDVEHRAKLEPLALQHRIVLLETPPRAALLGPGDPPRLPVIAEDRRALMVYTSGTTGRPKGAVHTHRGLRAQIESLCQAWGWRADDRILLVLPLHHVHGIVNVQLCALWSGARIDVPARFEPVEAWRRFATGNLTLFMAVPTVYARLIAAWDEAPSEERAAWSAGCASMRLMVSGSAALPVRTLERWREMTDHTLLERYGMTEIGMALSNPLHGERRAGHVGVPLPGVEARLVDEQGRAVPDGTSGEIEVRGPGVFTEYWGRTPETAAAFRDGWFRTGDMAVVEDGAWRILGRTSVDILKTGGYKVSALEIEDVLREHPAVADCAVVGLADEAWGERVACAVVPHEGAALDIAQLDAWARTRLAPYKVPRVVRAVAALPRNAMGKVTKPAVRALLEENA